MIDMYRADHVGSLPRPAALKEARSAFNAGSLTTEELRRLEDSAVLEALEHQRQVGVASKFFPIENMALSPQCGFASMAAGNLLTEGQHWRKLELVLDTARKVWG